MYSSPQRHQAWRNRSPRIHYLERIQHHKTGEALPFYHVWLCRPSARLTLNQVATTGTRESESVTCQECRDRLADSAAIALAKGQG